MNDTHTLDALMQFLYHDLPAGEAFLSVQMLEQRPDLREAYHELWVGKTQLPKVQFNPSPEVLNRILQYSATTTSDTCCL